LEGVAEEVELDMLVLPRPVVVLAVDDPGLLRVKLQATFRKPTPDGLQHRPRFLLAPAMDDRIVSISLEPNARIVPMHPRVVERIVQEQVGEQRTGDTSLRGAFRPLLVSPVRTFDGCTKPPPNIQSDPSKVSVMGHGTFDEIMRNGIKERPDIQIDDPIGLPATFPCHAHCVERPGR
jgi:hypothetical protein